MQLMGDWARAGVPRRRQSAGQGLRLRVAAPGTAKELHLQRRQLRAVQAEGSGPTRRRSRTWPPRSCPPTSGVFNLNKGSIPVRLGMKLDKFGDCAKTSSATSSPAPKPGSLVPSIAHGMSVPSAVEGAMKDVVSQFWNDDKMTVAQAMDKLVAPRTSSPRIPVRPEPGPPFGLSSSKPFGGSGRAGPSSSCRG